MGAAAVGQFNDTATEVSANSIIKLRVDSCSHDGAKVARLKRVSEQYCVDCRSQRQKPIRANV
ncbi:hypothetical protein WT22_20210 [Burkholderia territorii]|nr:hypothetical protein WT22_20210 [Burkholderia territorii]